MKTWSFHLLPGCCVSCNRYSYCESDICQSCESELFFNDCYCQRCALPLPYSTDLCNNCVEQPPAFDSVVCPVQYKGAAIDLIHRFKFLNQFASGRVLTQMLTDRVAPLAKPDVLLPVPTYWLKRLTRGGNPTEIIAHQLADSMGLPVRYDVLARVGAGTAQKRLNRSQRVAMLEGLYEVAKPEYVAGKHVVLVDDVVTTGATVNNLATQLKQAGAAVVDVWALARTPYN